MPSCLYCFRRRMACSGTCGHCKLMLVDITGVVVAVVAAALTLIH